MTLQLSIHLRTFAAEDPGTWSALFDTARRADAIGIDRLVVSDHVVFGEELDHYARPELGGVEGGRQPTGPDGHWLEPLTVLSFVAASTERIRLGTGILLAALRRPVVLAKTVATLDVLSGGRVDLGVGVGWQRTEYAAAGLPFSRRGDLLDHTLDVCTRLWSDPVADLPTGPDGASVSPVHMMPKPVRRDGIPVWVSGTVNDRVASRIARFGAGWIPWGPDAADPTAIGRMKRAVVAAGASADRADALQVTWSSPLERDADGVIDVDRSMHGVPALAALGVTDLRIALRPTDLDTDELLELVRRVHDVPSASP